MLEIQAVEPGSIAAELELAAGDKLCAVNGREVHDLLDYEIFSGAEELVLEVIKADGELWELEFEKDAEEPVGLILPHPEPKQCGNNCIFCFVHQLPKGLRRTLYVKDEDYRFSYLYGSYITLTNLSETDLERILDLHLSPLYVSVHATDEEIRTRLLGQRCPPILELLKQLTAGGIAIHAQVVVCPGINDGKQLQQTVDDLVALGSNIKSLALVPVGLTGHRQNLPPLRPPTSKESRTLVNWVAGRQAELLETRGTRFLFAADEYYLSSGIAFPDLDAYEDLSQRENGVGMIPLFRAEAEAVLVEAVPLSFPQVSTFTGLSAAYDLQRFVDALATRVEGEIKLYPIENRLFGGHVTVAGLLTGQDIVSQLKGQDLGEVLLVPEVVLRDGHQSLLDDMTLEDLSDQLEVQVMVIEATPWGLFEGVEGLAVSCKL